MPRYVMTLKNERLRTYTIISWLIIALNFISFVYLGLTNSSQIANLPYFAAGLLALIFGFRFISKREDFESDSISLCFSLAIIAWIVMQFYWAAVVIFFLFLFQDISRRKLVVLFFDESIIYPSFPKRTIQWQELNNVILKDSILTIDLKNNKVLQNEIISPASEIDFNEFCHNQLEAAKK
ncbi:MAG: hypothetical protein ACHQFX_01955 [Chitinophagales bacterium]